MSPTPPEPSESVRTPLGRWLVAKVTSPGVSGENLDGYSQSLTAGTNLAWVAEYDTHGKLVRRIDTLADTPWIPAGHTIVFGWNIQGARMNAVRSQRVG